MDTIIVRDLAVSYRVGVTDGERAQPQRLLLDLEMTHDFAEAAASDSLDRTVDYFAVCQRLLRLGHGRQWNLIETLAVEIARLACDEFGATNCTVEVKKFIIPEARYVAVRATRERTGKDR